MKKVLAGLVTALFMFGMVGSAYADLVERDFLVTGDNLLTYDTESGLEWLDLEITRGMSYSEVESELASGGSLEGFSIANSIQVTDLYRNGGFTYPLNVNIFNDDTAMDQVKNLINLFGNTITDGIEDWLWASWGFIIGTSSGNRNGATLLAEMRDLDPYCSANIEYGSLSMDYKHNNLGTWLYREHVPVSKPTIADILIFLDESVADGSLIGKGKRAWFRSLRLHFMRLMLVAAKELLEQGKTDWACFTLNRALVRCDSEPRPIDFVAGEAVPELNDMISELMVELGCD